MNKHHFASVFQNLYRKALKHNKYRWVVILGTLLYLISPLDISPDVFPVLGWIDDGLVISLLVTEVSQLMTEQLARKSHLRTEPEAELETAQTITVDAVSIG